jgi:hypothetical protein
MFLELEASLGRSDAPDSIMDRVLAGLISQTGEYRSCTCLLIRFLDPP